MTERILRKVFENADFNSRNIIASEIEKLVQILTHREFSRETFFKSIDHFYKAIEITAAGIEDFGDKQEFLNEVYEMFFKSYSQKNADKNGIVYTPQSIVEFMVTNVNRLLSSEFGKTLSDNGVNIIDPCVGTGTFLIQIMDSIDNNKLEHKYLNEIFCNEIMLLPYYISSVNIEHYYYEKMNQYIPFENIIFTDSLDLIEDEKQKGTIFSFNDINAARARKELNKQFYVIIGNPPYNAAQEDANQNNPNTKNEYVDNRIRNTYSKDSNAQLKNKLYDPYVKFFLWASERLKKKNGIICFISNNSFMEDIQFDGMRKHLSNDFHRIYHLDLGGDVYSNPKLSGTKHNVFGIKVGVGITFLIRNDKYSDHRTFYFKTEEYWTKEERLEFLQDCIGKYDNIVNLINEEIFLNKSGNFVSGDEDTIQKYNRYLPLFDISKKKNICIFNKKFPGISTNRNDWVYDYSTYQLEQKMGSTIEFYNDEVGRFERKTKKGEIIEDINDFITFNEDMIKWSDGLRSNLTRINYADFDDKKIIISAFRPFINKYLYYDDIFVDRPSKYNEFVHKDNPILLMSGKGAKKISCFVTNNYPNLDFLEKTQAFPLYFIYGDKKEDNISDEALDFFKNKLDDDKIKKSDIFNYIYGILNHDNYFNLFSNNFKLDLPRIPVSKRTFWDISNIGKKLITLHLNFSTIDEYELKIEINDDKPYNTNISKMNLSKDKSILYYNEIITLSNIPSDSFTYKINGRSPLEWIIDQYKNYDTEGDEIISLIKKAVSFSLQTIKLKTELLKYNPIVMK